ncbi:DUF6443 domain-containing protein [Chryseobacterium sp. M5]|uniref:DUF6443 domain-containing protein n=1 Tax=Chryseobacterium sp. M5 TaxID=3379128 RepID=UPI0038574F2C
MKKIIKIVCLLLTTVFCFAQNQLSLTENFVYSKTCLDADCIKKAEAVKYIDGLGRLKQVVNIKSSPQQKDVVTHIEYDAFGRQTKSFLPVPQSGTSNGAIIANPLSNATQTDIYGSEKIYTEKILENSPLDRIQQQIQAGNDWSSKPVQFNYEANSSYDVRKYVTITTWVDGRTQSSVKLLQNFLPNQLYKNTVTDEDGNKTIEFKNLQGQVILVRKIINDAGDGADIYYVYNEYNQLAFVISPQADFSFINEYGGGNGDEIPDSILNSLCYQYRYDEWSRLVEKKLPGKGWEFMVYDQKDRVIMSQDSNLEEQGQWLFTKYDKFDRVVYNGITSGGSRSALQLDLDNLSGVAASNNESNDINGFNSSNMQIYYTNIAFPTNVIQVLSVNYYDTYPPSTPLFNPTVTNLPVLTDGLSLDLNTKGLPVASYVKNIEDDNWTKNYNWYDQKGRVIGSHSINHLGGYTKTESELDFSGIPKREITRHKRLDSDIERVITENFTYDHQNRLLTHTHQVDNNPIEYLTQNDYNELSQLKSKKVGGISLNSHLQQVDYQYNIRGWMTQINNPNDLSNGDLFGYAIKYTNPENPNLSTGRFNGNIAEVDWKTSTNPNDNRRRYSYTYDRLNRLLQGIYSEPGSSLINNDNYNEQLTYDLNGNIASLKRFSKPSSGTIAEKIDDLIYNYTGNRLDKITLPANVVNNSSGYNALQNVFTYDLNGNMNKHLDRGITSIIYNYLNLPSNIINGGGKLSSQTNYIYRADGTKLKKNIGSNNPSGASISETDYLDGFQYYYYFGQFTPLKPSGLQFVPTSEGYYDFTENKYIYNYIDHLGNVRLSYLHNGSGIEVLEESNYYPFGLKHEGYNALVGNPNYKYKYNGKELQESGMYDYGARFYMPDIGRWGVTDPLAELRPDLTPYRYAFNNPIAFTDPTGMYEDAWSEEGDFYSGYFDFSFHWSNNYSQSYGDSNILSILGDIFSFQWGIDFGTGFQSGDAGFGNDMMQDMIATEISDFNTVDRDANQNNCCPEPSTARKTWNFVTDNVFSKPIEGVEFLGYFFYGLSQVPGEMYKQGRMENIHVKMDMTIWGFRNGSLVKTMEYVDGKTIMTEKEKFEKMAIPGIEAMTFGIGTKLNLIKQPVLNFGTKWGIKTAAKKSIYKTAEH